MRQVIQGEQPFQVLATNFSIGPSNEGYTLQISADGNNYSDLFSVGPNITRMITGVANGSFYRMRGNNSQVVVNWETQCNDGGSGGGGGQYILPPATTTTLGGVKVGQGLSVQPDGTLSASGGSIDPTIVQQMIDANNEQLEEGNPIVGMARQLYSPDGIVSEGVYAYRTTAGDEDVSSGPARLYKVEANSTNYPLVRYDDAVVLERNGEPVEGFEAEIEWGGTAGWEVFTTAGSLTNRTQKAKFTRSTNSGRLYFSIGYGETGANYQQISFNYNQTGLTTYGKTTAITATQLVFGTDGATGTVDYDGTNIIVEITGRTQEDAYIRSYSFDSGANGDVYMWGGTIIPNDIPIGESSYSYNGSWSPALPQAIVSMTINDAPYVPENGDEINITRNIYAQGYAEYAAPEAFVSVGLNSYSKDEDTPICETEEDGNGGYIITLRSVPNLEDGYVVFSNADAINSAVIEDGNGTESATTEITEGRLYVAHTTSEQPFIKVATNDPGSICIHPRWSGYNDETFEDYEENEISLANFANYPLLKIGETKNVWDVINGKAIVNIGVMPFTNQAVQELVADGKELGVDFEIDESNIYYILDEAVEYEVESEYEYKDNDFGVEYLYDSDGLISVPVKVETHYMTNLVDKLRRMRIDFVHLNDLSSEGEENITYEYNGRLFKWVNGSGVCGEWIGCMADTNSTYNNTSNDMLSIFAYSYLPTGQTIICTLNYFNDANAYVVYVPNEDKIKVYNDSGLTSLYKTISKGEINVQGNNRSNNRVWISWIEGIIQFRIENYAAVRNRFNPIVSVPHYEIAEKDYAHKVIWPNEQNDGLPIWNKDGVVIGKRAGYSQKTIYFNTTGYSNYTNFLTTGANGGPTRIFVPQVGGTAGQVLTSAGDNTEPVWATMIKALKITTAAYEALVQAGTTDPNTLYLIVDE